MTGFYTTERQGERWTLLDDKGSKFYSLGVNCFNYGLGEPMEEKLIAKYGGAGWYGRWADAKLDGAWSLGFNTLAAWHAGYFMNKRIPRTHEIRCSRRARTANNGWGGYGFPDVFDPSFAASTHDAMVETYCNRAEGVADESNLIGVYTDNELHWWGSGGQWGMDNPGEGTNGTNLVEDYIKLPPDAYGKKAWVDHLRGRYGTIERLNASWASEYESFDDLLWLKEYRKVESVYVEDKLEFLKLIAETYFRTTSEILRTYDANHLNLGCRVVGTSTPDVVLEAMAKYVDVISINFYCFDLPVEYLDRVHRLTGKPMMITEFSFGASRSAGFDLVTNGLQLAHVRDQRRRGECYRAFVEQAASLPYMVGTHWFSLYDFWDRKGLIGNYGLYDKNDDLWTEFASAIRSTHIDLLPPLTGEKEFRSWR
ncbi:hypothetical protein [Cohnella herbarum]|uniref:Beta-agarase n=1 Tax=Cohnella herbarum TaxID=2728023 RepID=A0A7Z2ZPU4_9BACL|nr:hypothetical protein [Cohnella herbarum]QJD87846.1 hypothetical protein HH215_34730 [Cohnella herbarum]